jgi:ketosteroid isomerase-like protein
VAHQSASELLAPILEKWERGDFWAWDECFAPDLLVTGFDADGSHEARGPEEITRYLSGFFQQFRDYRIEVGQLDELSEQVVLMEGRQLGAGRVSGLDIAESLFIVFRFASGRLTEMHWHPKREGALAAAGLPEEPG